MTKYPFRNLIFQGGGIKALAYLGTIRALEDQGVLSQIERVAGSSAGAMLSTILSFRLSAQESITLFQQLDYGRIASRRTYESETRRSRIFEQPLDKIVGNVDVMTRMLTRYGWYSTDYVYDWLQQVIAEHCGGNGRSTFADFQERGFRDLYIVATNISQHTAVIFSADTTPDVAVADALLMSQCIPLFFESIQFDGRQLGQGDYYGDGGLTMNYPLYLFDDKRYVEQRRWFIGGVNWETLGCRLHTPPDCPQDNKSIGHLLNYIEHLIESLYHAQKIAYEQNKVDQARSINISNRCVATTDFDIRPTTEDDRYVQLVAEGEKTTHAYLQNYRGPISNENVVQLTRNRLQQWGQRIQQVVPQKWNDLWEDEQ